MFEYFPRAFKELLYIFHGNYDHETGLMQMNVIHMTHQNDITHMTHQNDIITHMTHQSDVTHIMFDIHIFIHACMHSGWNSWLGMELLFGFHPPSFPNFGQRLGVVDTLWIREFLPRLFPKFSRVNKVRICYGEHEGTLKLPRDSKF